MITFSKALAIIQQEIEAINYPEYPDGLYKPVAYMMSMKGKKIRPALTLLACNLFVEDISEAIKPALAWETFHNFTLMHDDLMDRASLRRGQQTVHKRWNDNTAILSGDAMLILAYKLMEKSPANIMPSLLGLFSRTAAEICEGQQFDMEFENRIDITVSEYIEMIRLKTAVMIGACLKSGAIVGGASERNSEMLYRFGINLGIAFQICDDLLDVYGNPYIFGKNIGGDILCDKKTFLLVNALNLSENEDRNKLLSWFRRKEQQEEKIGYFKQLFDKLKIRQLANATIVTYYKQAMADLDQVSVSSENKEVLKSLSADLMKRES
ncbi:MAG: polyprenyl synthetase family protein [Dysgonamonadaceae bacterium]|jgi:geranylgeranyl diphosphate synthase type II|nr:polyprenyl synthetase family protein [Dysgonamonadaceae bacterium]